MAYTIVDIDTGEVLKKTDSLILKTITYEKTKREFIRRNPDGTKTKSTYYDVIRLVRVEGRQCELF